MFLRNEIKVTYFVKSELLQLLVLPPKLWLNLLFVWEAKASRVVCDYHPVEVSFEVKASSSLTPQRAFCRLSGGRRSDGLGSSIAL